MSLPNPLTGKCVGRNPLTGKFAKKCQELDSSIIESPNKSSSSCTEASRKTEVQVAGTGGSLTPPTISETRSKENACASEVSTPEQSWKVGRRIVELHHMAKQMYCTDCDKPLHLSNIVHESRDGFGSVLMIECECGIVRDVTTGKTHRVRNHGPPIFDVNTKAALGTLHSGTGHTQVTNFMALLEIQGCHHTTFKKREKEVEPHIESVANQSCSEALCEEIEKQQDGIRASDVADNTLEPIRTPGQFKYDMGWQKRGSGRAYDSKSGVGTLIGNKTGKICAYGVRTKDCRLCSYHNNKGNVPPKHDCKKNWCGSSKAMESSVAVETVAEVEKENVDVSVLIMDDDTTTLARIKQNISHPIIKWSDTNHTKKHLGNSLYSLHKKHKNLSNKCIQFLQKCFGYAVAQNKNNPIGLKSALTQIVPHAFGDHGNCDLSWCGYLKNPESYMHKSLPYGHDLSGEELQNDLNIVFGQFITHVEKIAPAASTKDVESFNNMVASKAPKRIHYSASSSLHNRVNCAVAEKNIGSEYVNKVNMLVGLSPGRIYKNLAQKKDKTRKRRQSYENTRTFKKQKLARKLNKSHSNAQCELREGITYKKSVDLCETSAESVIEIPAPKISPILQEMDFSDTYSSVYCDIETTSLSKTCDIIQIAATANLDIFSQYIMPSQPIAPSASDVTGLKMQGNVLFLDDQPVSTLSLYEALSMFLAWLDDRQPCVLVGHNLRTFNFPRIVRAFDKCKLLSHLVECVVGIVDTLPLFREIYPAQVKYNQENLVLQILGEKYSAHNAEADVSSLQKLLLHSNPTKDILARHSFTIDSLIKHYNFDKETDVNLCTLSALYETKVVTKNMCEKIARSGLQLQHLKLAYDRGGLSNLLSEKVNGKPRVTSTNRIVQSITDFFMKQLTN